MKRVLILVFIIGGFVLAQTLLHLAYLTTETNRAIFSSFRHFKESEDVSKDPWTIILIYVNGLFVMVYLALFIAEAVRSYLDFRRLPFSHKLGLLGTAIMVALTLFVLLAKASRQGGFSTQLVITVIYNAYMWLLAFVYVPKYA